MTHWYYADAAHQRQGPVDADELRRRQALGELQPGTLVWREGLADWQPLYMLAPELGLALAEPGILPPAEGTAEVASYVAPVADVVYAGFWRRFAASVIDSFLIGMATLPIALPLGFAIGAFSASQEDAAGSLFASLMLQGVIQLFSLVVTVTYFSCFHASRLMATPGKLAVGIKVVRGDGQRLTMGRSIGRGFAYYLSVLTFYIGLVITAFTQRKQALHDLICDTLVVDRWAYTDTPQRQRRGLDTVTLVILSLYGLLFALILVVLGIALVAGLGAGS